MHHASAFVSEPKMFRIPFAHLIAMSGFEEDTADSEDAPAPTTEDAGPSLFTALQEQLGLRLSPGRGPVEVLVIDQVERPSGN
jgi:uncharacterized protein (TIGR03435 family)